MSTSGPIILTPPPPPPPPPMQKILGIPIMPDAKHVMRKASTWLVGIAGLSTLALATYAAWPSRLQELTPDWALGTLGVLQLAYVLVPAATSIRQKAPKP